MTATPIEWVRVVGALLVSWPVALLVIAFLLRRPLRSVLASFGDGQLRRVKIGAVELERELSVVVAKGREAVSELERTNRLMARSRLLELEITSSMFGQIFSAEQRERMERDIQELQDLVGQAHIDGS